MYQVIAVSADGTEEFVSEKVANILESFKILNRANLLTQSKFVHTRVYRGIKDTPGDSAIHFHLYAADESYIGVASIQEVE